MSLGFQLKKLVIAEVRARVHGCNAPRGRKGGRAAGRRVARARQFRGGVVRTQPDT